MTDAELFHPPLNQIAFSVVDLRPTERWFREGLGFLPSGGSRLMMSSPLAGRVQGLPRAASTCWWLVGRNRWFQLEMFQFRRPVARLMPADARPCDIGYRRIGVCVADFDATLGKLEGLGTRPLGPIQGVRGQRRACVRNPDGVFVEVMEADPRPQRPGTERAQCPVAVRSITLSTPDLAASVAYLKAILGSDPTPVVLHTTEHEAMWGLAGAVTKSAVFECGDVFVELVQYVDPVGKPWPQGYRISDQGILNIAFGARTKRDHRQIYGRAKAFGARPNFRPLNLPGGGVVYVNDPLGFSVELLWIARWADRQWGFEPLAPGKRALADNQRVESSVEIDAPVEVVWAALNDQENMARWIGFEQVNVIKDGSPGRNDRGSERMMKGLPGTVVEQIVTAEPMSRIRYRIIQGSPFVFHQAEIRVDGVGQKTRVTWSIRFRSRIPLLGGLWRGVWQGMLSTMLRKRLKEYVERGGRGANRDSFEPSR